MTQESPLRSIRKAKGFSLQDVCSSVDVDNGHLSRIERGEQTSPDMAEKLSLFFNQEISEIEILYPKRFMSGTQPQV